MDQLINYFDNEPCNIKKKKKCIEFLNTCTKTELYNFLKFLGKYQYVNPDLSYNTTITKLLSEKLTFYED